MKKTVTVRGVTIGEGIPKICVPMVGETLSQLTDEAVFLNTLEADVVEWRVDHFEHVGDIEKVLAALNQLHFILSDKPLIFTFRSAKEGGQKEVSSEYYNRLYKKIIETQLVDIIDIELEMNEDIVTRLIDLAHKNNVFVIVSNHDFKRTPPKDEILSRLQKAQELGADIPKIAVMPTNSADVLTLMDATNTMYEQFAVGPLITMSMSGVGIISRLSGEVFGSALTFGAGRKGSAPGQIPVHELREMLKLFHSNLG